MTKALQNYIGFNIVVNFRSDEDMKVRSSQLGSELSAEARLESERRLARIYPMDSHGTKHGYTISKSA